MLAMDLVVTPHLVGNTGLRALRAAIAEPDRYACEPKVDGVRAAGKPELIALARDKEKSDARAEAR